MAVKTGHKWRQVSFSLRKDSEFERSCTWKYLLKNMLLWIVPVSRQDLPGEVKSLSLAACWVKLCIRDCWLNKRWWALEEQSFCDTGDLLWACNLQLQAVELEMGLSWMGQIRLSVVLYCQSLVPSQACRIFLKSVGMSFGVSFFIFITF